MVSTFDNSYDAMASHEMVQVSSLLKKDSGLFIIIFM